MTTKLSRSELQAVKGLVNRQADDLIGTGQQFGNGALGAFVNHHHPETAAVGQAVTARPTWPAPNITSSGRCPWGSMKTDMLPPQA